MAPRARLKPSLRGGHFTFPADTSIRVRRTASDPLLLEEAEAFIIDTLASKGPKGMNYDRLFQKTVNNMISKQSSITLGSFEDITFNGPFERKDPMIIYAANRDPDVIRRLEYVSKFFPGLPLTPNPNTAGDGSSPYLHNHSDLLLSSPEQTLVPDLPLLAAENNNGKTLEGIVTDGPEEHLENSCAVRGRLGILHDMIAFIIACAGARACPVRKIIRALADDRTDPKEILKAIADGPFHISSSANVSYLFMTDKSSSTRSRRYCRLVKSFG